MFRHVRGGQRNEMTEVLTSAQMRSLEASAISSGQATGLELMERAGAGVVAAVLAEWPELQNAAQRAVVFCGPGNNGGDGFVIARLLHDLGWGVEVFLYGDGTALPPDAQVNHLRWRAIGEVQALHPDLSRGEIARHWACVGRADVVIDAVFGIGLDRAVAPLSPMLGLFNMEIEDSFWPTGEVGAPRIVSVDVPTGLCADSGRHFFCPRDRESTEFAAHLTVTFHRPKFGHFLESGPKYCHALRVVDIGLAAAPDEQDPSALRNSAGRVFLTRAPTEDWLLRSQITKADNGHKFTYGHALILSGGPGRGGAARLSARGALRIGAGLVSVGCPPDAVAENAAQLDAVMLQRVAGASDLALVLKDRRINALCLGPGLGLGARQAGLLKRALAAQRALVLDADALTLIANDQALFVRLHSRCVLTPHGGEFARLFPDIAENLAAPAVKGPAFSKVDATRAAAIRSGCVVLFKGTDTVIASPDGRCAINGAVYNRAAPWLATAGSGDVLAGFITGLLARGFAPFEAACSGAWLHVECARSFGPGLIAEDLADELPRVFRALGM